MKKLRILFSILVSGACWYLSFDLSGDFWYLLWLAPVPVLLVSFRSSASISFAVAFLAFLIGRLSWVPYLLSVLPPLLAIVFTVLFPIVFAVVIVVSRKVVLKQIGWSVFAFPVLWCFFEFLMFKFSPDGTAGSIAYSEANFLPVIQIASVTGIIGVSFLVTLFPSAVALVIHKRYTRKLPLLLALIIVLVSLSFGMIRASKHRSDNSSITVGLAVVDEKFHSETDQPKAADVIRLATMYAGQIAELAQKGADVIVLPEKMINIKDSFGDSARNMLQQAANLNHVTVVAGYTQFTDGKSYHNNAWVISADGHFLANYQKVNLFEGEAMSGFVGGDTISAFDLLNVPSGVAICKDMDYDGFMRMYAVQKAQVLYVPAWDFIRDGWLHSRMAIVRGVENGYAIVRTARQGRLTVSDYRGKVLYEASCENNKAASLVGKVNVVSTRTIYSRFGDWFGYVVVLLSFYFLVIFFRKDRLFVKNED